MQDPDPTKTRHVMEALLQMNKIESDVLQVAHAG
jgi:hypothetical protein